MNILFREQKKTSQESSMPDSYSEENEIRLGNVLKLSSSLISLEPLDPLQCTSNSSTESNAHRRKWMISLPINLTMVSSPLKA